MNEKIGQTSGYNTNNFTGMQLNTTLFHCIQKTLKLTRNKMPWHSCSTGSYSMPWHSCPIASISIATHLGIITRVLIESFPMRRDHNLDWLHRRLISSQHPLTHARFRLLDPWFNMGRTGNEPTSR